MTPLSFRRKYGVRRFGRHKLFLSRLCLSMLYGLGMIVASRPVPAQQAVTVASGQVVVVDNGDTLTQATVLSGGALLVQPIGNTVSATVSAGGTETVTGNGSLATASTVGGTQHVVLGGLVSGTVVLNGGLQTVAGGGGAESYAFSTVVSAGGVEAVGIDGIVVDTRILSGGAQAVAGTVYSTVISAGGTGAVTSGGVAWFTTVLSGGVAEIQTHGTATTTTVASGGLQTVAGTVFSTVVSAGGQEIVANGGIAVSTTVLSAGSQTVGDGGLTHDTEVGAAGTQTVLSGGWAQATTIHAGGRQIVHDLGLATDTSIGAVGTQTVLSAGVADAATIVAGGQQVVYNGGLATRTLAGPGGTQIILGGGLASGTVVASGGIQSVENGGTANHTMVRGGGALVIGAGAMFDALVVDAGAVLDVETDATIRRASYVARDGSVVPFSISENIASSVVIDGVGWLTVTPGGTASATVLNGGKLYVHGNAIGTQVNDHGIEVVYSGGAASGTVVGSGGRQNILEGGVAERTSVTSGVIDVAGTASNVTLHNAATLTGTGRIASDLALAAGSTLAAATPGTGLTVLGALDFKTGSTYAVTVANTVAQDGAGANVPAALGGVTTVTGNVAIAPGATLTLTAMPGLYTPGVRFAIVNYGGAASGRFDAVDDDFAYVVPALSYDAGEIAVTLVASPSASFAAVARTGDQAGVGTALTRVYRAGGNALTTNLLTASPAQARAALTQLAGDEAPAFRQIAERRMDQAQGVIGERLGVVDAVDGGTAATATAGMAVAMPALAPSAAVSAKSAASGNVDPAADAAGRMQREWWVQGSYQNARTAGNDATGAGAYLDRSTALTIGHDRAITPTVRVGAALVLNTDTVSFSDRGANGRVNGAQALLYGSFTPADRPLFVNTVAGYGWWNNTLSRQVTLGTLSGNANGSFDTMAASLYTEAGLNLASAIGAMQPYVGVKVGRYQQQGYAESAASGTSAFDLRYGGAHTTAASSLLGVRVKHDGDALFGHGFDWRVDVAWQHRFGPGDSTVQAAFVDAPTAGYRVGGTKMDHDALRTTLGVKWAVNRTTSLCVNAGMSLGATTQAYAGNAGVQWRW